MLETSAEIAVLQSLLDESRGRGSAHLRSIVTDEHVLTAEQLVQLLTGMKVLSVATVTARGEPRISAMDGHFLHGTWTFGTDGTSAKAKHIERRPAVSVAHIDGERLALFSHGTAQLLGPGPELDEVVAHWTAHYGSSPMSWGDDIRMYRLRMTWAVAYASDPDGLLPPSSAAG
ncbi:pyridoxamine 5'-phosphate oxidase family protein [Intrasporangium calvum]|uniref:Pyridoxamine 5'-phosphate oxidase family protein n=1 Tax=Intrasporangium calvum TaxID=53358 RepID=A0ABT5GIW6_9MICO|nr:pyridoxamine 5'-phosphate oxidase family protein [Intrasporangium calvum]MDC5698151.1 pyridoxamine 5'-phosphate oxidase family protein [Intrasporangium calvum]